MNPRTWMKYRFRVRTWIHNQRNELISELALQAGEQTATQFKPLIDRLVRYAQFAAWFGIAGFVVGLLALATSFLVIILVLM